MDAEKKLLAQVEVKDLPEMTVAYLRHVGSWQSDSTWFGRLLGRLMQWAGPRGLLRFPQTRVLAVYRDDPDVTDPDKLRADVCLTVPPDTAVEGEIGKIALPGGRYAVARFEITPDQYGQAWEAVYGGWLPESGFEPDDRPALELYGKPGEGPEGKHVVDVCVPLRPAGA